MRIKYTPTLTFHYDDGPERGVRVAHLLDERVTPTARRTSEAVARTSFARPTASC